MKKIIKTIFFEFIIIICVSCAQKNKYTTPVNVFMKDMPPTMHFQGFTVYRPLDERWFINVREQSPRGVIFRIENPSPTHTFSAIIQARKIAITPRTKEELKDYVDKEQQTHGPRHEILSCQSKVSEIQGQWAILFSYRILDKAPSNSNEPLLMTMIGFNVLHPSLERTVIRAYYSQRGKEDELDDALDDIGQSLIDGVVLDSAPGTPFANADVSDKNAELFKAAGDGDFATIQTLLAEGTSPNTKNDFGDTALMMASMKGHAEVIRLLLGKGAKVDIKDKSYGTTALMVASQEGHTDIVQLLEKAGAKE